MPTYLYQCTRCRERFEVRLSFAEADSARPRCPACRGRRVQRLITAPGMKVKRGPALTRAQMEAAVGLAEQGLSAAEPHAPHPEH